ncbi:hypothetical protein [Paenarthrobacter nitroguajacolicus]|uniref:hypothetical protein n=1 Tax=Paenarthrobacter nitroguajacolicus TaxID=211146 RepID=UPI00248D127D|nr:hypothetical protein [Paenarthrobacter nitroguajacolicus]MDI2035937.1 hypothetical protein [Paenarthrobacter nitroguajacolicus]
MTFRNDDAIEVPDDRWLRLRGLADGAKLSLGRHAERMKDDLDYREAVEHLTKQLCELPGHWGKTVRIMATAHTLLVKVL